MTYRERLHRVIPGGAHTYSRGDDQFPQNAPAILERGKGAYVWDPEGKKYLDYGMGLRSVTLGYANKRVNEAAYKEMNKGMNLPRASTVELEAAELLIDLIPCAEMVKFAKNGSNVTTAAVKIARAATGKKYICIPRQQPFFSFDDWFIGTTPIKKGIPPEVANLSLHFDYGNIDSLQKLFEHYPQQIACVIMEPTHRDFLHQVQTLCRREGALFVLDEMITGFRWHLSGAQTFYDVEPDLSTFGKAMANGFPLAALVGKREFMALGSINQLNQERLFLLSSTHGAEMAALGAFIETIKIYKENNVIEHIWSYGKQLFEGINKISQELGLLDFFYMAGIPPHLSYVTKDREGKDSLALKTLFAQEMIEQGILMPWICVSLSHQDEALQMTLRAVKKALVIYAKALKEGISKYLKGDPIKPVFRKYN